MMDIKSISQSLAATGGFCRLLGNEQVLSCAPEVERKEVPWVEKREGVERER